MSDSLIAVLIFGCMGLAVIPLAAFARSVEIWLERRRAARTSAE
jgi:hypothetical protein